MSCRSAYAVLCVAPACGVAYCAHPSVRSTAPTQGHTIENFLVSGASKRGWTAWLVGCVDKRAIAIAPIVMDMLNFQKVGVLCVVAAAVVCRLPFACGGDSSMLTCVCVFPCSRPLQNVLHMYKACMFAPASSTADTVGALC